MALIAVAVVLVLVAAAVFYFVKKGGGEETPASDETAVKRPRVRLVILPRLRHLPNLRALLPQHRRLQAGQNHPPVPAPAKPAEPEPSPKEEPVVAKVTQAELDQLVQGLSYQDVVGIIGGEGVLFTDTLDNGGRVWVYVWPTEGLTEKTLNVIFINGLLDRVNLYA